MITFFYIYDEYFFKVTRNLRRRCNSAFIYVEKWAQNLNVNRDFAKN